jgi:PQQ-dependent catabolism-associated CXXCW motif protein
LTSLQAKEKAAIETVLRAALRCACLVMALSLASLTTAAPVVPEPRGYWMGATHGPVAATLAGGKVIHTRALAALLKADAVLVVDVSEAPRRPEQLAAGALWLPLPHPVIPGAVWIPGAGLGAIAAAVDKLFRERLALGTHRDPTHEIVIYCHASCWLSWNAAKRAISYGYQSVYWYPDGMEGWRGAGLPTAAAEPQSPPAF